MKKFMMVMPLIVVILMIPMKAFSIVPNVPSNVTLSSLSQTQIKVTWQGDADADNYTIYWGLTTDASDDSNTVGSSIRTFTITGLTAGTKYYVSVSASNNSGTSSKSSPVNATTQADTVKPATPTGFTVTSIREITLNSVPLKWDKNAESDLEHYIIYYGLESGSLDQQDADTTKDSSSLIVTGLSSSTRYYFAISAVDDSGNESDKSSEIVVDTVVDNIPPFVPVLSAAMSGQNSITVKLSNNNSGMVDYAGAIVYYGNAPGDLSQSVDVGDNMTFVINNLPEGKTWYLAALSYDVHDNKSAKSSEISIKIEDTQSYLGQSGKFDGGCFIQTISSQASRLQMLWLVLLMTGIILCLNFKKLIKIVICCLIILLSAMSMDASAEEAAVIKQNMVGISGAYFVPSESDFSDYYDESVFPVFIFYDRVLYKFISADIEAGYFKENGHMLTVSGGKTEIGSDITMVPVSASLKASKAIMPYIVGYIGTGFDYWYCNENTDSNAPDSDNEEWVGGYHFKGGLKLYNMDKQFENTGAIVECDYAVIDKFGSNDLNVGGLTLKLGFFYQF
jgi:fibronectin type 3 domain-containing protein